MEDTRGDMEEYDAAQLWASLGEEGKAPTELNHAAQTLPIYTVGFEGWIDRITKRYLQGLCRRAAHFKLILAPYGGGKTHFLVALGVRALKERFAVAYVPCGQGVSLDSPLAVYRELVQNLQLPVDAPPGLSAFLETVIRTKRDEIRRYEVPDVDAAFRTWVAEVRRSAYPENAFGRVMAAALESLDDKDGSEIGEAAVRWLQGDIDTLAKIDMEALRLARIPARERYRFGLNILLSLVKFLRQAPVHGLVLLLDEVETLFQVRGTAARSTLAAMRVFLDVPTGMHGGLPLLGVFSATPDVLEEFRKYPALEQRLAVRGAGFDENNDFAPQIPLDKVQGTNDLLTEIGEKLIYVGRIATGVSFDQALQKRNAQRLAHVASERSLDVDARRLFVKTWVGLLTLQASASEREFGEHELAIRYAGTLDSLERMDSEGYEP